MQNNYNPDVLSCLANLSSDEVFTPPKLANEILNLLPQEIWKDKNATFLDPVCKSGVFLREIAKRLIEGLEDEIPNLEDRINHIYKNQIFGIAITELTSYLSRRSLYCSKRPNGKYSIVNFSDEKGNIFFDETKHDWKNGRCSYCGASQSEYEREQGLETHAYQFIHNNLPDKIKNMKFDVIIGNPPYQMSTGGAGSKIQAVPLFHKFVEQAKKLNPQYLTMIIPARWYNGGIGLNEFKDSMFKDNKLKILVDYPNSRDCFSGVDIAGGVCYFLWDKTYSGKCKVINESSKNKLESNRYLNEFGNVFIRYNKAISILEKLKTKNFRGLSTMVYSLDPFGFTAKERGKKNKNVNSIKLIHSQGFGYIDIKDVKKNKDLINHYKVIIGKVVPCNGEVGVDPTKGYKAITTPKVLGPGEIHTFSYLLLGTFKTKKEAENFKEYIMTKFARFLLRLTYSSMNISKSNFDLIPLQDFNESWTDEKLYKKYKLTKEEIEFIESMIRPMN
jgi:site-specific DNA-methyltransferase (adenine-specific)